MRSDSASRCAIEYWTFIRTVFFRYFLPESKNQDPQKKLSSQQHWLLYAQTQFSTSMQNTWRSSTYQTTKTQLLETRRSSSWPKNFPNQKTLLSGSLIQLQNGQIMVSLSQRIFTNRLPLHWRCQDTAKIFKSERRSWLSWSNSVTTVLATQSTFSTLQNVSMLLFLILV